MEDRINHPKHYEKGGGIECIDALVEAVRDKPPEIVYPLGAAFKYIWRCGVKPEAGMTIEEKTIEDIDKAIWYLNYAKKRLLNNVNVFEQDSEVDKVIDKLKPYYWSNGKKTNNDEIMYNN